MTRPESVTSRYLVQSGPTSRNPKTASSASRKQPSSTRFSATSVPSMSKTASLRELQSQPVIDLDEEAVVRRRPPERVQVAAEPEVAEPHLVFLLALPDEEDRRARA